MNQAQTLTLQVNTKTLFATIIGLALAVPATLILTIALLVPRMAHADTVQTSNANPVYQVPAGYALVATGGGVCPATTGSGSGAAQAMAGDVHTVAVLSAVLPNYSNTSNQTSTTTNINTTTTNNEGSFNTDNSNHNNNNTSDSNNGNGSGNTSDSNNGNGSNNGNNSGNTATSTTVTTNTSTTDSHNTNNSGNVNSNVNSDNGINVSVQLTDSLNNNTI